LRSLTFTGTGTVVITGQASLLLLAFVTLAWRSARRSAWPTAGVVLGLAMSVKPFLLIFVPYFLLRRYWRATATALGATVAAYVVAFAVFGLDAHRDWLRALDATDWAWAAMNGSLLGILSRTLGESPYYAPAARLPHLIEPIWRVCALIAGMVTVLAAS
jgi:hypothetical protein